ncbi:glycosyltransferase [Ottowia sp. GY511]|uniref:Glycosyltransferase n=1 Tax=Ottowia flava TaxID=2675430 RepID=A0ABW4KZQ4_9BURK|nr:glycosyltransferase [Ottowia sp. GY511]TXK27311.1 glycosyltransferase [Ottowia sp. GY511]
MRIAHLILTRHFAGSERHAIELANAQSREHEVSLVLRRGAAGTHEDAYADLVDPRVNLVLVPDWLSWWHATRALRRIQPDVAHAHLSAACRALRAVPGLCLRVATLHIRYKPQQHADLDALVAIAPWQLREIPTPLRGHTAQIDNWILPHMPSPDARSQLRAQHGIPADAWVFGAMGRAEASKGFDTLIDAFEQANLPNTWLVVVGHGPALAKLQRRSGSRVVTPGFSRHPKDWLSAFDAFVSPARSEPFGLVLLEAMQAGLPIIATRTEGALHLADAMAPVSVPIDDSVALTTALTEMLAERPPRRDYPIERFDIAGKLRELDAFYLRELDQLRQAPAVRPQPAPDPQ